MNSKQLESRVRKLVQDAGKRQIYLKAEEISLKFSKEFGVQKIDEHSDHTNCDRRLRIFTGTGYVCIKMWNSHYGPNHVVIELDDAQVFWGHDVCKSDFMAAKEKGNDWQYAGNREYDYVFVELYRPGQWQRVLEMHEAERLLKAERDAKQSVEEKEKKAAEEKRTLTDEERKIAANFGIKV